MTPALETKALSLMDDRLQLYKEEHVEIFIYLSNGIRLSGKVMNFDTATVLLTSETGTDGIPISRSFIATVMRKSDSQHQHNQQEKANPRNPRK